MKLPEQAVHPYWFVALQARLGMPHWLYGLLLTAVLLLIFLPLSGAFAPLEDRAQYLTNVGTGLFFALVLGYSLATGTYTVARTRQALTELRPRLDLDDANFTIVQATIGGGTRRQLGVLAAISLGLGLTHAWLLADMNLAAFRFMFADGPAFVVIFGTLLTWFCVTHIVSAFVSNAIKTATLCREHLSVDLLQPASLTPIGTIALLPALVLMGAQVFYPLITLGGQFNVVAIAPGFIATLGSLVFLFATTSWSAHRQIHAAKTSALQDINVRIVAHTPADQAPLSNETLAALQPLLSHRNYLQGLSSWPFSESVLPRLLFYLVLPPLTWAGAALMENGIQQLLGG
ncbi:MAG: hypothetical protein AAF513_14025 [Pseudomonadota bacterium]